MGENRTGKNQNMGSMNIQASLLGRLRKAAKALVKREGFEASELETVLVFEKALSAPEIAEAWAELNRLRLGLHTSALRPGAFLLALGLTLGDLHLSLSAEKQDGTREIWDEDTLYARLTGHYQTSLDLSSQKSGMPETTMPRIQAVKAKSSDKAGLKARTERWLKDLLPYAVGCILNDAKVIIPSQAWETICNQDHAMVLGSVPLTARGRHLVCSIGEAIPTVREQLDKRLTQVFELNQDSWEELRPSREEAVFLLRAQLYSQQQSGGVKPPAAQTTCFDGETDSNFQQSLRELMATIIERQALQLKKVMNEKLDGEQGEKMYARILDLLEGAQKEHRQENGPTGASRSTGAGALNDDGADLTKDFWAILANGLSDEASARGISKQTLLELVTDLKGKGSLTGDQAEAMRHQIQAGR